MVELHVEEIAYTGTGYRIRWSLSGDEQRVFHQEPLEIGYGFAPPDSAFGPLQCLLAAVLPVAAREYRQVRIRTPFPVHGEITAYWDRLLQALAVGDFRLEWHAAGERDVPCRAEPVELARGRTALLYGGGVESNYALAQLYPTRPVLVAVVGERWMNNDAANRAVKEALEDALVAEQGVELERVRTNARVLVERSDYYVNELVTGPLFYWLSLPVLRRCGAHTLYYGAEMETALVFGSDRSIVPQFLHEIVFPGQPLFVSILTCYPKLQILEELARTPFIRYVYSCLRNTERRWCGDCAKCARISDYCALLGLDRTLIGMQAEIRPRKRKGLYWLLRDRTGRKAGPEEILNALRVQDRKKGHARAMKSFLRSAQRWAAGIRHQKKGAPGAEG